MSKILEYWNLLIYYDGEYDQYTIVYYRDHVFIFQYSPWFSEMIFDIMIMILLFDLYKFIELCYNM